MSHPKILQVSLSDLSRMIDHSLLHPTMTDSEVLAGLQTCKKYKVKTACIKPYHILFAKKALEDSPDIHLCPVIGFPHGNSTVEIKAFEAKRAVEEGGNEIDMVVNIGRVRSGKWEFIRHEIETVHKVVTGRGATLKVIFENDYLSEEEIVKLCKICSSVGVAFIQTSTGHGFCKLPNGDYNYKGAKTRHLELMRKYTVDNVQIKAAGGIRTLNDLLRVRALGVTRVGVTATEAILEEAKRRGIGEERVMMEVPPFSDE